MWDLSGPIGRLSLRFPWIADDTARLNPVPTPDSHTSQGGRPCLRKYRAHVGAAEVTLLAQRHGRIDVAVSHMAGDAAAGGLVFLPPPFSLEGGKSFFAGPGLARNA